MTRISTESPPPTSGFETEASAVLRTLRRTVASILSAVPDLPRGYSATDVQRSLRINGKLSWQIHKFVSTERPLDVAGHLPKPAAMMRFAEAAKQRGVPSKSLAQLADSLARFEQLVERHAGDRAIFDSMVGSLSGDATAGQIHQQHRRDAFRAQVHLYGMQAQRMISLMIFTPGARRGTVDGVTVGGHVNVRRFRHDARWILFGRRVASDRAEVEAPEPLDPESMKRFGAPLLAAFCSNPSDHFRVTETEAHVRYIEAVSSAIGNDSAATYLSGEVWRNVAFTDLGERGRWLLARARVRVPVEAISHDILVHRDLPVDPTPELDLFSDLRSGDEALSHPETERLPLFDSVTHLGRGPDGLFTPDIPRYPELAEYAMRAVQWNPHDFDVYRCRVAYPVLPSTLVMRLRAHHE